MFDSEVKLKKTSSCKSSAIDNWLDERNELLVLYCKLSGQRNQQELPKSDEVNQFCDILVDYVSAGHFEVYEQIVNECETNGPSSLKLLEQLYPKISQTTDVVVNFNDKYANFCEESQTTSLDNDLSVLGEAIAQRVELEDNLIETLKSNH
jgi:regulator of sigma D